MTGTPQVDTLGTPRTPRPHPDGLRAHGAVGRAAIVAAWVRRAARVVRTLIGAPDYDRYVAHMRLHHPGCTIASRDEFMQQRLESRYSRPGSRCC